jgi:energy-converting hydrogenase Eha subunit A
MMLDQNRWTGAGFADALLKNIISERVPEWKREMSGRPTRASVADQGVRPTRRLNFGLNGHSIECRGTDIQMKLSFVVSLLVAASFAAYAQPAMPRMIAVDPPNGKKGDVITVTGENLQKDVVSKVYLTDGKNDIILEVTEQTGTAIKFKIPVKAAGRLALMILTTGKDAKYIEQPVKLTIDPD